MKKLLFLILCFCGMQSNAQKIIFEYDEAGNQILRSWCLDCPNYRQTNQPIKEITQLKDSDLQKFFPEDVISYYPNPVKEELYLKWELINQNKVSNIEVYALNGQLLKSFKDHLGQNSKLISFIEMPIGVYFVKLNYLNGDQKSVKIIKN